MSDVGSGLRDVFWNLRYLRYLRKNSATMRQELCYELDDGPRKSWNSGESALK